MKRIYIFRITIFITILVIPIITMNFKSNQISEIDNKVLTEASDIFNGDITNNIETYLDERIGFRTIMINAYTQGMDYLFNYMVHPSYQYGKDGYVFGKLSTEDFNSEYQDIFSDFILKLQNYCNDRNIDFLYSVEPSKATVYSEFLPEGVNYKNYNTNYFLELLYQKNINHVYTGEALIDAKDEYQVFDKKYDANHWNETGAIIGVNAILDKLNEMDSSISKFSIDNYELGIETNTTLPVSYFPINEKTTTYKLNNDNIKRINTFNSDNIQLSKNYSNFYHYINEENTTAPKVLFFAGSYFTENHKFLLESFSEFILVHNYINILDFDYYINLFNPDIVIFESAEYTHSSTFFNQNSLSEAKYNKSLTSYSNLTNSHFTSLNGDFMLSDNGIVTYFSLPITNNETLYSYALIGNRILDCKTVTDENDQQYVQFSIPTSELEHINSFTIYTISNSESEYSEIKVSL
ncbi:alginate O-acetyltransferase [Clostridium saudiense]|uniref:alginate O-acetyltransferase n=1 Tax=Clostridium saudiense TaxID=1414720 RepID=UPI00082242B6|nr:alginate O-acetyltransferase [Clostridium saudiense]MDU7453392.1 alginate O-acetyltransferase [Clostridium saudiense]SCJ84048.1 Uncharacterised protein [uncultured Clostridium sp.]